MFRAQADIYFYLCILQVVAFVWTGQHDFDLTHDSRSRFEYAIDSVEIKGGDECMCKSSRDFREDGAIDTRDFR